MKDFNEIDQFTSPYACSVMWEVWNVLIRVWQSAWLKLGVLCLRGIWTSIRLSCYIEIMAAIDPEDDQDDSEQWLRELIDAYRNAPAPTIFAAPPCAPWFNFKDGHSSHKCIKAKMIIWPASVYGVFSPATSSSPSVWPRSPRQSSKTCLTGASVMSCQARAWCPGWMQEFYLCQEPPKSLKKWKNISTSTMTCQQKGHFQEKF